MKQVYRAEDEPVSSRADYWQHVVDRTAVQMDVRPEDPAFRSRVVTGALGAATGHRGDGRAGEAIRTTLHVRRSPHGHVPAFVQVRGQTMAEQDGRQARLKPGDLSLAGLSRPFRCTHRARRAVCVTFPHAMMPLPRDEVAPLTETRLATSVVDLVTVALATRLDRRLDVPADARQRSLTQHVHAYIERQPYNSELSPSVIAAAHHISRRYLHKLFEPHGVTVASWVRQRRLDRCRRDLLDPALRNRPASAIGARWGFTDPAFFTSVFRATFGVPPGEYRRISGRPT